MAFNDQAMEEGGNLAELADRKIATEATLDDLNTNLKAGNELLLRILNELKRIRLALQIQTSDPLKLEDAEET